MIRTELMIPSMLVSACALLVASCESTTQVGSDCRDGVCPRENLISSEACVVSSTSAEIAVTRVRDEEPGTALGNVCLPRPLPINSQGQVACRVLWRLGEAFDSDDELPAEVAPPSPEQCSDLPFLEAAGPGHAANVCMVKQLTAEEVTAGELDGWFYNDDASGVCGRAADPRPAVSFTPGATPPSGVVIKVACSNVQAAESNGELVSVEATECGELANGSADGIGDACLPTGTPAGGFADQEAYVESRSDQCDTEACLVYKLRGYPNADCDETADAGVQCASEREVEQRAYCSCRCDAPAGDPGELCECGDGLTCVPVLEDGPPGIRGSYCVRDGTFTPPN
jgi:hypothetical protein